jgi:hypothetical protein
MVEQAIETNLATADGLGRRFREALRIVRLAMARRARDGDAAEAISAEAGRSGSRCRPDS